MGTWTKTEIVMASAFVGTLTGLGIGAASGGFALRCS
jgi:hypothetical protein